MRSSQPAEARIRARDRALSLLNNITTYIALAAVAGVGIFGTVSALTIPGVSSSAGATASSNSSTASDSSASSSTSSGLSASSGSVSSSSNSGVAVSGGS